MPELMYTECIVVGRENKKYYVLHTDNNSVSATNWQEFLKDDAKYTYHRGCALSIAHNMQKNLNTENGVWELY